MDYPQIFYKTKCWNLESWLLNGKYDESEYLNNQNIVLRTFVIDRIEEQMVLYWGRVHKEPEEETQSKKVMAKIQGLIDYIQFQNRKWRKLTDQEQTTFRYAVHAGWNDNKLFELFLKVNIPDTQEDLQALFKEFYKTEHSKYDARSIIEKYVYNFTELIKTNTEKIISERMADDYLFGRYNFEKLTAIWKILLEWQDSLDIVPPETDIFERARNEWSRTVLDYNLRTLSEQVTKLTEILEHFQEKGPDLIAKKLNITEEFWNTHTLSHYGVKINSIDDLSLIIANYVAFEGLHMLLKVGKIIPIVVQEDFNQELFLGLNIAVKDQSGNVLVRKMPKGPQLAVLKTIKQGRTESLDHYLRPDIIYKPTNRHASREQLIQRINKDCQWIVKNVPKIDLEQFAYAKSFFDFALKNSSLLLQQDITSWGPGLIKAANRLEYHRERLDYFVKQSTK